MSSSTERIRVGLIGKPSGLEGFVTVRVETDDEGRFAPGLSFPGPAGNHLVIETVRDADRGIHLRFQGYRSRERAEELRGHALTIAEEDRRVLDDDEFWPDELAGMRVVDQGGALIGAVIELVEGSAQDRLVIKRPNDVVVEVPFVFDLVPDVDRTTRTVTIVAMPGLIEP